MKYPKFILIAVVAVLLAYFLFAVSQNKGETQNPVQKEQTAQSNLEIKRDEQGQVTVKVTPLALTGSQWKFNIVMDTHSVELDQDMTRSVVLYDDQGREYKPTRWDGPSGGHHREGVLIFQPLNPAPAVIELKMRDIGGVPERSFQWDL